MKISIPANRVAAIATWLTAFAAFVLGIVQILPSGWQNYALIGSGLLVKVATTIKFLDGAQKWDALTIGQVVKTIEEPVKSEPLPAPSTSLPPIPALDYTPPVQEAALMPTSFETEDELDAGPPDDTYDALNSQQWLKNRAPTPAPAPAQTAPTTSPPAAQRAVPPRPSAGVKK
jgi:hypothetical protein